MKNLLKVTACGLLLSAPLVQADQVILDDLIVDGSACIGLDCVNGESFGFDTIRIKENNLRIRAFDTSSTASFPTRDWQLTFNDSSNGGAEKFSVDDIDGGRTPFTIEAGAPSHSIYADDGGRIGFGTSTPVVELHVKDGDTPTLRLEQDGTSGFTPQTWDVAGNETNFFVRDASNGSTLPFRIQPGSPSNAIYISATDGNIGMGTTSPSSDLNIFSPDADLEIESTGTGASGPRLGLIGANEDWEITNNGTTGKLVFFPTGAGATATTGSVKFDANAQENLMQLATDTVTVTGNIVITGDCTEQNGACADYVFEPDYKLRSLDELNTFISENGHLPNVPSAEDMEKNGVNITHVSGRLLEKIEELVLYTLEQQATIDEQSDTIDALVSRIENIEQDG